MQVPLQMRRFRKRRNLPRHSRRKRVPLQMHRVNRRRTPHRNRRIPQRSSQGRRMILMVPRKAEGGRIPRRASGHRRITPMAPRRAGNSRTLHRVSRRRHRTGIRKTDGSSIRVTRHTRRMGIRPIRRRGSRCRLAISPRGSMRLTGRERAKSRFISRNMPPNRRRAGATVCLSARS